MGNGSPWPALGRGGDGYLYRFHPRGTPVGGWGLSRVFVAGGACMFRQASGNDGMVRTRAPVPKAQSHSFSRSYASILPTSRFYSF